MVLRACHRKSSLVMALPRLSTRKAAFWQEQCSEDIEGTSGTPSKQEEEAGLEAVDNRSLVNPAVSKAAKELA